MELAKNADFWSIGPYLQSNWTNGQGLRESAHSGMVAAWQRNELWSLIRKWLSTGPPVTGGGANDAATPARNEPG